MALPTRLARRIAGLVSARLPELRLDLVVDPRHRRGKWPLTMLLTAAIAGIASGCRNLQEVERLTERLSRAGRKLLRVPRRVPDTTLRDLLDAFAPHALRPALWRQVKAAIRRKAVGPYRLPFGVVTMDGRSTATRLTDEQYAQTQHPQDGKAFGLVRTITSTLVSSRAKVCLDMNPIPPTTNEMGYFKVAFEQLAGVYGEEVFQLVTYDSGACSEENGRLVEQANRAYLFRLKQGDQPTIFAEAERTLGRLSPREAEAETTEMVGRKTVIRRVWRTAEMAGWHGWEHLRTVLRVETETIGPDGEAVLFQRYFISSLRMRRLTAEQWLEVVRRHWGVENKNHWVWDAIFKEDERPWILSPRGMLTVMLLRRIAYNLLALFRSVTQRSEEKRRVPWKDLISDVHLALATLAANDIAGLRARRSPAPV